MGCCAPEHSSHLAPAFFTCTPPPRPPAPQAHSSVDAFDRGGGSVNESRWCLLVLLHAPPAPIRCVAAAAGLRGGGPGGWGAGEVLTPIGAGGEGQSVGESAARCDESPGCAPLVASRRASPASASPSRANARREKRVGLFRDFAQRSRSPKASRGGSPRSEAERRGGAPAPHVTITPVLVGRSPTRGREKSASTILVRESCSLIYATPRTTAGHSLRNPTATSFPSRVTTMAP